MRCWILFTFLIWFTIIPGVKAEVLFVDDFNDGTKVDTSKTTSLVDIMNGWVQLPLRPLPNALALNQYVGKGYAVAESNGVSFFAYDNATSQVKELSNLKLNVTNPLAVSLYSTDMSAYVLLPNGDVKYFEMNGSGFVENPALSILGTNQVISISSADSGAGKRLLTIDETGQVQSYASTGSEMVPVPSLSFQTGITNPVSISAIPGSDMDFVVTSKTGAIYYAFDGSSYQPIQWLTGLSGIVSAQVDAAGDLVATVNNTVSVYLNSGGGNMVDASSILGQSSVNQPISVSLNQDIYEYGVLTGDGQVRYYEISGGNMAENTAMTLTGLNLTKWHESMAEYRSQLITSPYTVEVVRLFTEEQNDSNTTNTYEISTDGGVSFQPIVVGTWKDVTPGTNLVLRALQETTDPLNTPRLLKVIVEVGRLSISSLTATKQYLPGLNQTAALPTMNFPIYERTGGQVEYTVKTTGAAESVVATYSDGTMQNLVPVDPISNEQNTWFGWYEVPMNAPQGQMIGITLVANRGAISKQLTEPYFIQVDGTSQSELNIHLVK